MTNLIKNNLGNEGFELQKNNVVKDIGVLYKTWSISFDLMPTELVDGIFNIIRVGDSSGTRIPAIFLKNKSSALEVRTIIDGKEHAVKTDAIPLNEWTHVEMVQMERLNFYEFIIRINNVEVHRKQVNEPVEYDDVKVYASDQFQAVGHARIRNLIHESNPDFTTEISELGIGDATTTTTSITTTTTTVIVTKTVEVSTSIEVATTIEYSAELSDPSSTEYATQSQKIKDIFQSDLEEVAKNNDMTLNSVKVKFTQGTSRRKRRSTSTDTSITAVYSKTVSESTDLSELEDTLVKSTSSAATKAISNSAGTYINTDAVPAVSSLVVDSSPATKEEEKCDGMYDGDSNSGCFTLNSDGKCIISNPSCQSLMCTDTHMKGFFRGDLIGVDSKPQTPALVNNAACSDVTYNDELDIIEFEIALGDCGMNAESIDGNIKLGYSA